MRNPLTSAHFSAVRTCGRAALALLFLLTGFSGLSWGIFCFMGGADGQVWVSAGLFACGISWGLAILCTVSFFSLNRRRKWAWILLLSLYELPLLPLWIIAVCKISDPQESGAWFAALGFGLFLSVLIGIAIFITAKKMSREHTNVR